MSQGKGNGHPAGKREFMLRLIVFTCQSLHALLLDVRQRRIDRVGQHAAIHREIGRHIDGRGAIVRNPCGAWRLCRSDPESSIASTAARAGNRGHSLDRTLVTREVVCPSPDRFGPRLVGLPAPRCALPLHARTSSACHS